MKTIPKPSRWMRVYGSRLLHLADFLDKLPRKRFYFGSWVGDDWKGEPDLSCGTTACALGWATTMPRFRKLGLRLERFRAVYGDSGIVTLKAFEGSWVSEKLFGLNEAESSALFLAGNFSERDRSGREWPDLPETATARQVSRRIRQVVQSIEKFEQRKAAN